MLWPLVLLFASGAALVAYTVGYFVGYRSASKWAAREVQKVSEEMRRLSSES